MEPAVEPRLSEALFADDRSRGYADGFGGFIDAHSAEEAHLDDPGFPGVNPGKLTECSVKRKEIRVTGMGERNGLIEGNPRERTSALQAPSLACVVYKDLPHEIGCDAEEMGPVLEIRQLLRDEA